MDVKSLRRIFKSHRSRLFLAIAILLSTVFSLGAIWPDRSEMLSKRMNIAMRAIGHDLLLRAGDFTSVVPPVIEKPHGIFQIQFENEFAFLPDTLIAIVQRHLSKTTFSHYTATVLECNRPDIVYGFENSPPANINIPCRGRSHPKACYKVEIAFTDFPGSSVPYAPTALIITSLLSALALVLIGGNKKSDHTTSLTSQKIIPQNGITPTLTVGKFAFDTANQSLRIEDELIPLTDKECKILSLLHQNIGQLTSRDLLIQQVWTDEGVITGRSLDMFISKLRKKLGCDVDIRITTIHGKGYRLDISEEIVA